MVMRELSENATDEFSSGKRGLNFLFGDDVGFFVEVWRFAVGENGNNM